MNGFLSVEQFKKDPLVESTIGKLFLALLEEKEWSKDFEVMVCFDKGKEFITILSEELFSFSRFVRFEPTEETPATMESVRNFLLSKILDEHSCAIGREKAAKKERAVLAEMLRKIYRHEAFQFLKAKAPSGRVYPPKFQGGYFGIYYAVNGNGLLFARDSDVDYAKNAYFLKNMTKGQFEKERLNLPFRNMIKGAKKL